MGFLWTGSLLRVRRKKEGLGYLCPISPGWFSWNEGGVSYNKGGFSATWLLFAHVPRFFGS